MINYKELFEALKALSCPHRLMIVEKLTDEEFCACKLLERFRITQPTLLHHIKTLRHAGFLQGRMEWKWMYYNS